MMTPSIRSHSVRMPSSPLALSMASALPQLARVITKVRFEHAGPRLRVW